MRKVMFAVMVAALLLVAFGSIVTAQEGLTIWADDTRAPILEELGAIFEEEYGVPVTVQQLGFGDIRDNFKTSAPAGEGPDIIVGAHDWLGELVVNGLLAPVELGDLAESFVPVSLQAFTIDGVLYAVPYVTENIAFLRNPELVPDLPATWDDVKAVSEALVAEGKAKYGFIASDGDSYHHFPLQTAFGGYVFGQDEAGNYLADDLGIDSEGTIAAATWWDSMVKAGLQPTGVDYDVKHTLFETGEAAMIITGPWAMERIRNSGVPYVVSAFPTGPDGTTGKPFLGVQGFMISAFSENQVLAEAFLLEFVASEEIEVTITVNDAEVTGTPMELFGLSRPSAFLPALEMATDPDFPAFAEAGAEAMPMPAIPEMSSVWSAWGNAWTNIVLQQSAPDAAMTEAAEQIRTAIAGS